MGLWMPEEPTVSFAVGAAGADHVRQNCVTTQQPWGATLGLGPPCPGREKWELPLVV